MTTGTLLPDSSRKKRWIIRSSGDLPPLRAVGEASGSLSTLGGGGGETSDLHRGGLRNPSLVIDDIDWFFTSIIL